VDALAWLLVALLAALAWARLAIRGLLTQFRVDRLRDQPAAEPAGGWPRLAVVAPCRDEAAGVEAAARSFLDQDYPGLEVLAVDDRSSDGTGEILDHLAARHPGLRVRHVAALPEGWLGKNHACHVGAAETAGEWILFADGDVVLGADVLRRAVSYAEAHRLGHLVALPRLRAHGFLERAFVTGFAALANGVFRTWELRRPRTAGFIGVGAFNLVRRSEYERVGGHLRLALEVVDDAKLGLLLRRSGVRQGAVDSGGLVTVRWQAGLVRSLGGLVKNLFAGVEYSWPRALLGFLGLAFLSAAPLAAALLAPAPAARGVALYALGTSVVVHGLVARQFGDGSGLEGLLFPLAGLAVAGLLIVSAAAATLRGGIVWRGTRYPIASLRRGCLRAADLPVAGAVGWE